MLSFNNVDRCQSTRYATTCDDQKKSDGEWVLAERAQDWEGVNFDETGASRAMSMICIQNDIDVRTLALVYIDIETELTWPAA